MRIFLLFFALLSTTLLFSQGDDSRNLSDDIKLIRRTEFGVSPASEDKMGSLASHPAPSAPTGSSTEVGITEGQLSVSLTGGASYSIPIAVPPGINGIVPQISLSYNSQGGNGLAGYGWNISGVSVITKIPATKYHDNNIDPVDFDSSDRFSFDGQRLMIKNGTSGIYGANATVYETESFSNVQITSYGVHPSGVEYGPAYFVVQYPDGAIAHYGNSTTSRSLTDWGITYWQNPQGVRITYNYVLSNNSLSISSIKYGTRLTTTPINEISFVYQTRLRSEQAYVGNINFLRSNLLKEINIRGNNVPFRNYVLEYGATSLAYQTLLSITEKSGNGLKSLNPTIFHYETTTNENLFAVSPEIPLNLNDANFENSNTVSGDFDGDGKMDFIIYPTIGANAKKNYSLYTNLQGTSLNIGAYHNVGSFVDIFATSWLNHTDKLMPMQGWCVIQQNSTTNITSFKNYSAGISSPIYPQYEKTYEFPKFSYTVDCPNLPACGLTQNGVNNVQEGDSFVQRDFPVLDPITCPQPANVYLSPIISNQATLMWNDAPIVTMWEVCYFEMGTAPNPSNSIPAGTYSTTTQNFLEVSNLMSRKFYSFFVRSICSGQPSAWVGPINSGTVITPDPTETRYKVVPKEYVSGDFNGDGLTDVIAIDKRTSYQTRVCQGDCYTTSNIIVDGGKTYFVNLDRRLTSNFVNSSGQITTTTTSKFEVADVNGDGKSDLMVFDAGSVKVYSLNNNKQLVQIGNCPDIAIKADKQKYFGDFNGDGKIDFVVPQQNLTDSWSFFFSTGTTFKKITSSIGIVYNVPRLIYWTSAGFPTGLIALEEVNYTASDYNGDGKSDIIVQTNLTVEGYGVIGSINYDSTYRNPIDTRLKLMENMGFDGTAITFAGSQVSQSITNIRRSALPIFLDHNNINQNLEYALISGSFIKTFKSSKDNRKDSLLNQIILGNGLKEIITYQPLNPDYAAGYDISSFASSTGTENYPNFDISVASGLQIVSKVEHVSATQYKQQKFKYEGAVSNLEGLGFLGFRGQSRTNWFNEQNPAISSVSKHDITKRGAISETYTVLGEVYGNFTSYPTVNFINKTNWTYAGGLLSNKVYKINNPITISINGLDNTSKEVVSTFDEFNNPLSTISVSKNASAIERTETVGQEYYPPVYTPIYYNGRLKQKNTSINLDEDTATSEEVYTYNTNHLLSKIQKKGHFTNYITEDNIYDVYGNITKKTISAIGLAPRVTSFTYDPTGRFLITSKNTEGLITIYSYDASTGLPITQVLPSNPSYPLTTTFLYDVWGKKTGEKNYLDKLTEYNYLWLDPTLVGFYTLRTNFPDGSVSYSRLDDLGRKIADGYKTLEGGISWKAYEYDIYDRQQKEYEPKLGTSPQWSGLFNSTSFDIYGRPTEIVTQTGKTTNIVYNGMSTITYDGTNSVTTVKNSVGYVSSVTDNGGIITYKYFANGNMKQSYFDGVSINVQQDGWGRKTKLSDPSAGTYQYEYNEFGDLKKETTLKGVTTYSLDDFGKVLEKTIIGLNGDDTNSKTTYIYDPLTKLMSQKIYNDFKSGNDIIYHYGYDNYLRFNFHDESGHYAYFKRATLFDGLGRPEKELYTIINPDDGKRTDVWARNTYKNGHHWQTLDDVSGNVLWQANSMNARKQATNVILGNGVVVTNTYDQFGYPTVIKHQKTTGTNPISMEIVNGFDIQTGNLTSRTNHLFAWSENYQYDDMDRLTHYKDRSESTVTQSYDDKGRIIENAVGEYNYSSNSYQNKSIDLTPQSVANYQIREGIFFDTMESRSGWLMYSPTISYDTSFFHDGIGGTTSLKVSNPSLTQEVTVQSDVWIPINNSQPTEYTYSAWVFSDGPQTELFLLMKDANDTGYATLADNVFSNTTGSWHYLTKTFLVPANIKFLNFRVDNNGMKNGGTSAWFDNVKIRKTSNPTTSPNTDRHLDIAYNAFKAPVEVFEPGIERLSFIYNESGRRSSMFYGNLSEDSALRPLRRHYSSDGTMEMKYNETTQELEFITYIGGDAYTTPVISKSNGISQNYFYLHRDHQGSIIAISNKDGQVIEKRLFDAWGNVLKVQDGQGKMLSCLTFIERGFTGHEHLQGISLINMNRRLYDPVVHRFLQPDNFIQDPFNTQSFNRYGYCYNNPFKYADVSGEYWIPIIIGAVIGAYSGGVLSNGGEFNPFKWEYDMNTFGHILGGAIVGGITGGVSNSIATSGVAFANTKALLVGSIINGMGTHIYTGGKTDVTLSFGFSSLNFSTGEFGYLFKKENSFMTSLGYSLGAIANFNDVMAGFNASDIGGVDLVTEHSDSIGHSAVVNTGTTTDTSLVSFGPDGGFSYNPFTGVPGDPLWPNHLTDGSPVWRTNISGINIGKVYDYSLSLLNKTPKYNLYFSSCVTHTSSALMRSGFFNIGIHPYILAGQAYLREIGFRTYFSHYLIKK